MKSVWFGKLEYNSIDWKHVPKNAKERKKPKKLICFLIYLYSHIDDWWTNGLTWLFFSVDNIYDKLTYDYFNYYCLDLDRQHMIFSSLSHLIRFKNIIFFLEKSVIDKKNYFLMWKYKSAKKKLRHEK